MIDKKELMHCLPHKGALFLLDRVLDYDIDAGRLDSEVRVSSADLFYDSELGGVPAWVGFEYMAQSIAALSGINSRTRLGSEPKIGFIMSVRDFAAEDAAFAPGTVLRVEVRRSFQDQNVVSFDCSIKIGARVSVTAIINAVEMGPAELAARRAACE